MEERKQEVKEEKSGIVVLDPGITLIDEDIKMVCCSTSLAPFRW
jgi:hypothetical protein